MNDDIVDILGKISIAKEAYKKWEKEKNYIKNILNEKLTDLVIQKVKENTNIIESNADQCMKSLENATDPLKHLVILFKIFLQHEVIVMRKKCILSMEKEKLENVGKKGSEE